MRARAELRHNIDDDVWHGIYYEVIGDRIYYDDVWHNVHYDNFHDYDVCSGACTYDNVYIDDYGKYVYGEYVYGEYVYGDAYDHDDVHD